MRRAALARGGTGAVHRAPGPNGLDGHDLVDRDWALGRLRGTLTLEDLADHAGMTVRTFTRRFREEVAMSPKQWITQQRVDGARTLLETTDLPVESIAYEAASAAQRSCASTCAR